MTAVLPGVFERLMGERGALRDSIARELEALLNTRAAEPPARYQAWPLARASVLNYGLADGADRAALCARLEQAIARHEPRLSNVSAVLHEEAGAVDRLRFLIHATLRSPDGVEAIDFDAVLRPSALHYTVRPGGRTPRP